MKIQGEGVQPALKLLTEMIELKGDPPDWLHENHPKFDDWDCHVFFGSTDFFKDLKEHLNDRGWLSEAQVDAVENKAESKGYSIDWEEGCLD